MKQNQSTRQTKFAKSGQTNNDDLIKTHKETWITEWESKEEQGDEVSVPSHLKKYTISNKKGNNA